VEKFRFLKWKVYQDTKELFVLILNVVKKIPKEYRFELGSQLIRASLSILLNIAEGSGKFSKADKKNFYIIARGSVYECVSLFEIILEEKQITEDLSKDFYRKLETISKMLLGLINSQITH